MDELSAHRVKQRLAKPAFAALRDVAASIGSRVDAVASSIDDIRDAVLALIRTAENDSGHTVKADLERLHPVIESALEAHLGTLVGAGFVADPEFLQDEPQWLEWRLAKDGEFTQMHVSLDADDVANYDYPSSPWFELPKAGAEMAVVGPYVDFGGTNDYVVTITKPVRLDGRFIGVAGADLSVDRVEGILRRMTRTIGLAAMVVTTEGRVIASSVPRMYPGALLRGLRLDVDENALSPQGLHILPCGGSPWRLVVLSCGDPRSCNRECRSCVGY